MIPAGMSQRTSSSMGSETVEGPDAVVLARAAVESEVLGTPAPTIPDGMEGAQGAFVTLSLYPSGDLRGCIGFPMPVLPLGRAIVEAGRSACHDPRFPDLTAEELSHITVEVTVLTTPSDIVFDSPRALLDSIEIGRDGLIISYMGYRGLLLPQVPVEWGWDKEEYLSHLSMKAGLPPDAWTYSGVRVQAFQGRIWHETSPNGEIVGM